MQQDPLAAVGGGSSASDAARPCMLSDLRDASESRRVWKLKCMQAEAELRALRTDGTEDESSSRGGVAAQGGGDADEGASQDADASQLSSMSLFQEESAEDIEKVAALSAVLALERHIAEMEVWQELLEQKVQSAKRQTQAYEERYVAECQLSDRVRVQSTLRSLEPVVQQLEQDVFSSVQRKEALLMQCEEFRNKKSTYISQRAASLQESAALRQAAQSRHSQMGRMQGELVRSRAKSERKLRQLSVQLSHSHSELRDAVTRSEAADEKLRKVRQHQSKQLRGVREETRDLQAEVQQHLEDTERSQAEMRMLRTEESELQDYPHRERQLHLVEQVKQLRVEVEGAVEQVAAKEGQFACLRSSLQDVLAEEAAAASKATRLSDEAKALRLQAESASTSTTALEQELRDRQESCQEQTEDLARLHESEAETASLEARSAVLTEELSRLREASRQSTRSQKRFAEEMREASKRCAALKAHHGELLDATSSQQIGRDAVHSILEQVTVPVVKKVELLLACLGESASTARKAAGGGGSGPLSGKSHAGHVLLEGRLQREHEEHLEQQLMQERKKMVQEQKRYLDEVSRYGSELQKARGQQQDVAAKLARASQALTLVRSVSEAQTQKLQAEAEWLEGHKLQGQAPAPEFFDLKEEQAIERNALWSEVQDLRRRVARSSEVGGLLDLSLERSRRQYLSDTAAATATDAGQGLMTSAEQRLQGLEDEAERLRRQEDELMKAHMQLKAAMLVAKQGAGSSSTSVVLPKAPFLFCSPSLLLAS